jgi:hypothetical protein
MAKLSLFENILDGGFFQSRGCALPNICQKEKSEFRIRTSHIAKCTLPSKSSQLPHLLEQINW